MFLFIASIVITAMMVASWALALHAEPRPGQSRFVTPVALTACALIVWSHGIEAML